MNQESIAKAGAVLIAVFGSILVASIPWAFIALLTSIFGAFTLSALQVFMPLLIGLTGLILVIAGLGIASILMGGLDK